MKPQKPSFVPGHNTTHRDRIISAVRFITIFFVFIGIIIAVIFYARGYRLNVEQKSLTSTGIISVASFPKPAKIFINDELKGVTDTNISLPYGDYTVSVKKEGYTDWTKAVKLKGELVMSLDALLFPRNPSLTPATNVGIQKAYAIPQSDNVLLFVDNEDDEKDGIYIFRAEQRLIPFEGGLTLLVPSSLFPAGFDWGTQDPIYAPNAKEAIIYVSESDSSDKEEAYLISLTQSSTSLFPVGDTQETITSAWKEEQRAINEKVLETFPVPFRDIATTSTKIIAFAPDEQKVLYMATHSATLETARTKPLIASNQTAEERTLVKDTYYVYDRKEDKNYAIGKKDSQFAGWYDPTHIVISSEDDIDIVDYDGLNQRTVYSGPFEKSFISTTKNGRLFILTNFNPQKNTYPDIYEVGLQ